MRYTLAKLFAGVTVLFTAIFLPVSASASTVANNGLEVEPALSQIHLVPGQTSASVIVHLTNLTASAMNVTFAANDFGALYNSGNISFYGKNYNPVTNSHSLEKSLSINDNNIFLPSGSTKEFTVNVNNANKLAPGGHFGAALFSPQYLQQPISNSNHISVLPSVASLIFISTASGGTHGIKLLSFGIKRFVSTIPTTNYLAFKNTGNTQTAPQGQLTLIDPKGEVIATSILNNSSGMILPGDVRLFTVALPLKTDKSARTGLYTLKLQYKDSSDNNFQVVEKTFLYVNWEVVLILLVSLILMIYIINKVIWKLLKKLTYFRVNRRHLKSIANYPSNHVPIKPKVMDIARPKRSKNQK